MESDLLVNRLREIDPLFKSLCHFVVIASPKQSFDSQFLHFIILKGSLPNVECSLDIQVCISDLDIPHLSNGLVLIFESIVAVLKPLSPMIEHLANQMLSSEVLSKHVRLDEHLYWFESLLMPLFDGYPHFVVSQSLNNICKLFKCSMTLVVKFAVAKELIHCHLFAGSKGTLQKGEKDFGHEQLVVVAVVVIHL